MTVEMADSATMPSQDDGSEEVSTSVVRDVMTVMTRRLEQLLVKQHERESKLFAELFDDSVVGLKRAEDLPDQKTLRDETAGWIPEDGILVHLAGNETVPTMACIGLGYPYLYNSQAKSEPRQCPLHDDGKTMRESYLPSEIAANKRTLDIGDGRRILHPPNRKPSVKPCLLTLIACFKCCDIQ